jgi:uncharacterized protein
LSTERPLLSISRKTLDEGSKEVRAALPADWLTRKLAIAETDPGYDGSPALTAKKDGRVDLRLTPSGGDNFLLQGDVHATIETTCGRCLGPATVPVDTTVTLLLVPEVVEGKRSVKGRRSKDSEGEFEFDRDEADVATYDGDTVILDDLVREAIVLDLPISALCSEDCTGMASDPAVAQKLEAARIDPRLQKLAALRDQLPVHSPTTERRQKK